MWAGIFEHTWQHVLLAGTALGIAALLGAALGISAAYAAAARGPILGFAALGRTIPSIALLTLLLPLMGVGPAPAVVALTLLALPPIIVNVEVGLRSVSANIIDAAKGLGMTPFQRFVRVSVPLALPVALTGLRTATVEVIASATLATFIGAGGLGDDIVRALQTNDPQLLAASTVTVALLAFAAEFLIGRAAARLTIPVNA